MKAVILAGGFGTRISEESGVRPKPMVEIGGKPILWHIMKTYSHYGINDFIICCGYKGYMIKEYFSNYFLHTSDVTFDMRTNNMEVHNVNSEPWSVTLVDTGENTMTGGRVKKVAQYIGDETFCLTYGDGVSNVDINKLISFHKSHGKLATLTSVRQPGRFGVFTLNGDETEIKYFKEKPKGASEGTAWINGGYFVLEPSVLDLIENDSTVFEKDPMENLAKNGNLFAYKHTDFWQPMDTLRDKNVLEERWVRNDAPWKVW
ncbi:glucose-1-phosphate cytidylyltransferase [Tamlana sp. 62-3]|uniref:Glucose-1-phosphate cytidylyltransferase n=1 Tax=Neotamlana sargassicola TaxID=2883125 RepID=A0A9X1IAR1_9FLAO|nr:glucose-1-phosphate cytidylyltransferase [Tamlana sargassicola]MCB4809206.1 glucose-1-phosphate cytidylyltransferase [Tamlana sargassicola]